MMECRPLRIEDRNWMTACRDPERHPFTALAFASLWLWRRDYQLTVGGDGDFFAVHSVHDGGYYCPCGDGEKCRAFLEALESGTRVLYLTHAQAEELEGTGWTVRRRPDLSEYVLSAAAQALREGSVSRSFRRKCRGFKEQYEYTVRPVTPGDLPLLRGAFLDGAGARGTANRNILSAALDAFGELGLRGILLETAEGELAYLMGFENSPEMFTMALNGYSPALPRETTAVSVHELARLLDGEYALLNLEEDLGLPGLRRAKELYSPVERLEVYEAIKP